jgi:hypothetical protein
MRMSPWLVLSVFLPFTLSAKDPKPAAPETKPAETQQAKTHYVQKANQELDEWSAKVQHLTEKSQATGTQARTRLDEHVSKVQERMNAARKSLRQLTDSGEGAFDSLRQNLEETLEKLRVDYKKALGHFKKEEK